MARGLLRLCAGVVGGRRRGHRAHDERTEIEPNRAIATVSTVLGRVEAGSRAS
jgi:hypothetical protein